jgi:hypothetical protein
MSTENVTPIRPPDGGEPRPPRRPRVPKQDLGKLTFRTDENDADAGLVLLALRYQFEAIASAIDTEGNDTKASYLALGGAAIAQGLLDRIEDEDGP